MARPSKLTADVRDRIAKAIKLGTTYDMAANYGGIVYNTFNEWMKRGEQAKSGKFREFYEVIKAAEGEAVVRWLEQIEDAANDGSWQAAAWKLERRYPHDYGRQIREITGTDGGPIQTEDVSLTDSERIWRVAKLLDRARTRRDGQTADDADSSAGTDGLSE